MYLPSNHITNLLVMVARVKGEGGAPPPILGWADFTNVMECTPESVHCHLPVYLYSLVCGYAHPDTAVTFQLQSADTQKRSY